MTNPPAKLPAGCDLYPLFDLPRRHWMPRKNGKPINRFTVLRWALHGRQGLKIRSLMVGGIRCTSDAWAMEFFEKLTQATDGGINKAARPGDYIKAEAELEKAGIR